MDGEKHVQQVFECYNAGVVGDGHNLGMTGALATDLQMQRHKQAKQVSGQHWQFGPNMKCSTGRQLLLLLITLCDICTCLPKKLSVLCSVQELC